MLTRLLATLILLVATGTSSAHFVFLVPETSSESVKAIFSDTLKPDTQVAVEKIENTKLFVLDAAGKESAITWSLDKTGAFYKIEVPGAGTRLLGSATDYGVLQRGDSKPFWLKYYAKTILGDLPSDKVKLGERVPVEIVPVVEGDKLRFRALIAGKPAAKVEISVMVPGEDKTRDTTTDENGLSPSFDKSGLYGVRFRYIEAKSGEDKGKKYEEIRHYATLVVNWAHGK